MVLSGAIPVKTSKAGGGVGGGETEGTREKEFKKKEKQNKTTKEETSRSYLGHDGDHLHFGGSPRSLLLSLGTPDSAGFHFPGESSLRPVGEGFEMLPLPLGWVIVLE